MDSVIFNTHDVVLLVTAYQCVLFATLLLTIKRENHISNIFLALFLIQQAAIPLDILISFGAEFRTVALGWSPNLFYVFGFGYWLQGPFLLWFTRSLIYKDYKLRQQDLWYLLPAFSYLIYEIFFYYGLTPGAKQHLQEEYNLYLAPQYMNYVTVFREVYRVALGILCLLEIRRYTTHIQTNFSDIEKLDLSWLKLLVSGFLIISIWSVIVVTLVLLSVNFGLTSNFGFMGLVGNYATCLFVSLLIFFGLNHSNVFEGLEVNDEQEAVKEEHIKDKIPPEHANDLIAFMEKERPYLVPALTLDKLASQLKIQPRVLSQVINRQFNCNFFEFINSYRVEEAKRILADKKNNSKGILEIMYDVGFNSKATFNTLFKKKVGVTPSEYRKMSLNTLSSKPATEALS
jgi:AraC-like DNA-binding protein